MTSFGNYEAMQFREGCVFHIATGFGKRLLGFFIPYVGNPFIVKNWRNIFFETILADWAS